ncbi:hydrogenase maturation nickel metallochaperone HypA [Serratia marcescens]|uniref:hydrogenase maturation nickel metallochaperone HypA n=1 Tax=Serratia marcescens TaxID=615 RepID=UPI0009A499F3|nr:hydrogenase maturation nickel metallochaperone HypA [Serratia marcescens]OPJ90691.1 hydrogenase maturation nickel metallochaperone HypA [Serratia marcescens]
MHEITLCQRAVELIESLARQNNARRVTGVWLEVGAFSCVETSSLVFCFDLVCRGTLAEGCELNIHQQEANCWCHDCQQFVTLLTQRVKSCPHCSGSNLRIEVDEGMQIKRLEIDQEIAHV